MFVNRNTTYKIRTICNASHSIILSHLDIILEFVNDVESLKQLIAPHILILYKTEGMSLAIMCKH